MELDEIKAGLIVRNKKTGKRYMVIQQNIDKDILLNENEILKLFGKYNNSQMYLMRTYPVTCILLNTTQIAVLNLISNDYVKDVQFTEKELKQYVTKLRLLGLTVDLSYCYEKVNEFVSLHDISKGEILLNENITQVYMMEKGYLWNLMSEDIRVRGISLILGKNSEKEYCLYSAIENNGNYYVVNHIDINLSKRGSALVEELKGLIRYGFVIGNRIDFSPLPYKSTVEMQTNYRRLVNHYLKKYSDNLEQDTITKNLKGCKLEDIRKALKDVIRKSPSFSDIRTAKYLIEGEHDTFALTGYIPLYLENKLLDGYMSILKKRMKKEKDMTLTENEQKDTIQGHIHNYENRLVWM